MTDIDDNETEDRTPQTLLLDLAQNHIRAMSSPAPQHPATMGWQMLAASNMALAARLLHTLQRVAPAEAAEIADWYHGPFGDGPDPMDVMEWLDEQVAQPAGADIEAWITDGRCRAQEAKARAEKAVTHPDVDPDRS
jgi:hypothetical protein